MRWTIDEDIQLLLLVRQHFTALSKQNRLHVQSAFSQMLHTAFNSPHRDIAALLYRLKEAKILAFVGRPNGNAAQQSFKCLLQDDMALYNYRVTLPTLQKPLHPDTVAQVQQAFATSNPEQPLFDTLRDIATLFDLNPMQVEKILIENNQLCITPYRQLARCQVMNHHQADFSEQLNQQTPAAKLVADINACRARAAKLYQVYDRDGAEVIFSADGTGFGKSYGVIQGYVDYLTQHAKTRPADELILEGKFSNLLFMSPQKSQIDLDMRQKEQIIAAGGEFICVLSRKDTADLDFIDWASGLTNRDRYKQWYQHGKTSTYLKTELRQLSELVNQIDYCTAQIENQKKFATTDALHEQDMLKEQLKNRQHALRNIILTACKKLFEANGPATSVQEYIRLAMATRRKRQHQAQPMSKKAKATSPLGVYDIYLEIIKQVLPFEVCRYRPAVLLMTTNKFDTSTYRLTPHKRGKGLRFESVSFDLLIGGKVKPEDPQINTLAGESHEVQVDYLRNEHFQLNTKCPFRQHNIRFTVVIDELHEAYARLEKSCHVALVKKDNNLAHVFSVVGRIYHAVLNLERDTCPQQVPNDLQQQQITFITTIRELLASKCELSPDTTLGSMLGMFRDQLGAFEVNSNAAERIISLTHNVFSFNAKMYVNEASLKRIRLRHTEGDITRIELYYELEGDIYDTNPTLHDLFQLVSAMLAASAQITNANFKRWIKNGGQHDSSSQNTPLAEFIDAANTVASEVRHVFDRTTDKNLIIDHFFTYLQPKTVFTMSPMAELNYVNRGAERTIMLAFKMDLVKELPEAMLLRLLTGTHNKVIGLSATSGFSHTKNGNFSHHFLRRYAQDLGYRIVERVPSDIDMLNDLRTLRARIRTVDFKVFDAEQAALTDIYEHHPAFKAVYDDFFNALQEPLKYALANPYKNRQHRRELEALLLAAYEGKNSLILSLSSGFKLAFAQAYRRHQIAWRQQYGMTSNCDNQQQQRHDQILTFTPFKDRPTLHLVFFDAGLARVEDIKQYTYLKNSQSVLVFMSTYLSAGSGLNYFVRYQNGDPNDPQAQRLDVDFQRLVLINSSFYSEVLKPSASLNTLPNYISVLKHLADDIAEHNMTEFNVNFAQGDNYRLLMAEHAMSLCKVIMQAVGRIERRDTWLNTEIWLPHDVHNNVAFQLAGLSQSAANQVVLESMSLLNYRLKEHGEQLSKKQSFSSLEQRQHFEKNIISHGQRIDAVHQRVLTQDWINRVRKGELEYLTLCNLFRDPDSFINPARWLEKLQAHPLYANNKQMQAIHHTLFISRQQGESLITLCHKRGADGLAHADYSALSDFAGGAREYRPELSIFPQQSKEVDYSQGNIVGKLMRDCIRIQKAAFSELVPHPKLVPLLKGNVGEYLFDKVLAHLGVQPLSDLGVFERLGSEVYEFFDRFIEVENSLLCIDVKRWATKLDHLPRAQDTLEKSEKKIRQTRNLAHQNADQQGQEQVRKALAGRYQSIKFIYLNAAYSQNPNNLMGEDNVDHSIHYLNLLQATHLYYQAKHGERNRLQAKSKLDVKLHINPQLISLLGHSQV
ncbi:hypothetical protein [Oceanisphaera avium]|uniref:Uncharacterized protein n=1 Tax=Oceanisphaera avium TaxID=1903694 RepID=A0A1Y0CWF6_9GAMM|nr:hypothetical protein [Oceanisphaera avium]ART79683.1 hypothetical protein CBP12_05555 [Oceanisphaera avium]